MNTTNFITKYQQTKHLFENASDISLMKYIRYRLYGLEDYSKLLENGDILSILLHHILVHHLNSGDCIICKNIPLISRAINVTKKYHSNNRFKNKVDEYLFVKN